MAPLNPGIQDQLAAFVRQSQFDTHGCVMTDLDGTAVHQSGGRIVIPEPVKLGLKHIVDLGRPFILNSLRFPLNVITTFGRGWYEISNARIPTVSLNGSLLGWVCQNEAGEMSFEEMAAFALTRQEVDEVLVGVRALTEGGIRELLVFYYPRDWRVGEVIWTPVPDRVPEVRAKYVSASSVSAVELPRLEEQLHGEEICMIFLLVEVPQDRLMAFQHAKPTSFITHQGVDKLFGAQEIARRLGIDLTQSVGAGDTPMDAFLNGVGLAAIVGGMELEHKGLMDTVRLKDSLELGDALFCLADLCVGARI